MRCPSCNKPMSYRHQAFQCLARLCPSVIEAGYSAFIHIKHNWWFASGYRIPFKQGATWYVVEGGNHTRNPTLTMLLRREPEQYIRPIYWDNTEVFSIPYSALPVNDDFDYEFRVLIAKFDRYFNKLIVLEE
jgi:hypothetical protein